MTITLNPDQEEAVRAVIQAGRIASVEEFIDRALAGLPHENASASSPPVGGTVAGQVEYRPSM